MDGFGEEEDLFDHDFGDVPVNTLQQIEQDAISLSQRPRQTQRAPQGRARNSVRDTDSTRTLDEDSLPLDDPPPAPSSDYGYDEDDVIDLNDPTFTFERNAPPIVTFHAPPPNARRSAARSFEERDGHNGYQDSNASDTADVERLKARVAELEHERIRLSDSLDTIKADAVTKDGAIANLRSRNQRSIADYESKIAALQKSHAEESLRLRAEIKTARSDQENIKTSNRFLEHDLAEERERSKRARASATAGAVNNAARDVSTTAGTPPVKTAPSFSFRDGFDDHEIVNVSPTKLRLGDKPGTPKGQKRKRTVAPSPSIIPDGTPGPITSPAKDHINDAEAEVEVLALARLDIRDEQLSVLRATLSHQSKDGRRTVEALCDFPLPVSETGTLATKMLEAVNKLSPEDALPTSVSIRRVCLDLWEVCLASRTYAPIPLLLDLFESILDLELSSRQIMLYERLIPLVAKTSVIVAEPRVIQAGKAIEPAENVTSNLRLGQNRHSSTKGAGRNPSTVPLSQQSETIDDLRLLAILYKVAVSAALNQQRASKFWHRTEFAFFMLMLNPAQPISHLLLTLKMVALSSLPSSFGPCNSNTDLQTRQESNLVDRLTSLFPDVRDETHALVNAERSNLADLHLQILEALRAISSTAHGSESLANNKMAIGRLARFLCEQVTLLYSTNITMRDVKNSHGSGHESTQHRKTVATINLCIRIIHHLLQNHDVILDDKLSVIPSGKGKLVIALSRVAFSERSLLDAGLEDQVVDAANEILDLMVNPEEGEAIVQVMESAGGHSSRPSLSAPSAQDFG